MNLPSFFTDTLPANGELVLDEETSKHIVQVLRMTAGERLLLTDGKGNTAHAEISGPHKKHCTVNITSIEHQQRSGPLLTIAISLIKNSSRFEWFLEKATELGTTEIIPLICERTEKQNYRYDRFLNICKSAMLQSIQSWLPNLHHPRNFREIIDSAAQQQKFIAHCIGEQKNGLSSSFNSSLSSHLILIGPEGDFTEQEVQYALSKSFEPVSLGNTRLRTETAGIYVASVCRP